MCYIPDGWIKDKRNEDEVRRLIATCMADLKFGNEEERAEARLKELGEDIILGELKKGTFAGFQ
ncbi:MAG: hypothetical protein E6119_05400 [Negativicoccus succinicivorans]|uniref:hypothetical protein n=1 Tax=Negativicoccus succinicivorans TaxID=620903 RepID=UPI00290FF9D9|nr:hypothetical protein [Negativicoccus succinicivorans]MDU5371883.1 hypothetical protein [Negativicoccus succinicivorans]MDU5399704.1 hypothetical protein [Negativicoccus succinicivorans]MDU5530260.1 hypothetical protein [Negativicoccus succinicivorans]